MFAHAAGQGGAGGGGAFFGFFAGHLGERTSEKNAAAVQRPVGIGLGFFVFLGLAQVDAELLHRLQEFDVVLVLKPVEHIAGQYRADVLDLLDRKSTRLNSSH